MQATIQNIPMKPTASTRSPEQIIELLRAEARRNKTFDDVCHMFAMRERARQQVTMPTLRLRMSEAGFIHSTESYAKVLKFLANLGIGKLELKKNGDVYALTNIKVTLQSLGRVAVDKTGQFESFTPAFGYETLESKHKAALAKVTPPKTEAVKLPPAPIQEAQTVTLTAIIDGRAVTFRLPKSYTKQELGDLLVELHLKQLEKGVS